MVDDIAGPGSVEPVEESHSKQFNIILSCHIFKNKWVIWRFQGFLPIQFPEIPNGLSFFLLQSYTYNGNIELWCGLVSCFFRFVWLSIFVFKHVIITHKPSITFNNNKNVSKQNKTIELKSCFSPHWNWENPAYNYSVSKCNVFTSSWFNGIDKYIVKVQVSKKCVILLY